VKTDGITAIVLPTYNEAENVEALTDQVLQEEGVDRIIIVDDNSPDGTGEIADRLAKARPEQVDVIHRSGKAGLGTAYIAGFRRAFEMGAARVVTMDADFSHQPGYIPAMLRISKACDLVIGSRYVPGGGTRRWSIFRQALSRGANAVAHVALGLAARDCTAGFRCYNTRFLRAIDLDRIRSNGYSFLIELLYLCQVSGARVGEVPIIFEDRRAGKSKISQTEILKAWQTVGRLTVQRLRGRPNHSGRLAEP
jgi:glycosyltransferase involved in cell wall biosynthesis